MLSFPEPFNDLNELIANKEQNGGQNLMDELNHNSNNRREGSGDQMVANDQQIGNKKLDFNGCVDKMESIIASAIDWIQESKHLEEELNSRDDDIGGDLIEVQKSVENDVQNIQTELISLSSIVDKDITKN